MLRTLRRTALASALCLATLVVTVVEALSETKNWISCPQEQAIYQNDPDTGFELQFIVPESGSVTSNPYDVVVRQIGVGEVRMQYTAGGSGSGAGGYRASLQYACLAKGTCYHAMTVYSISPDADIARVLVQPGDQAAVKVILPELLFHVHTFFVRSELNDHFTAAPDDIWWLRDCRQ